MILIFLKLGAKNGLNLLKLGAKNESNLLKLGANHAHLQQLHKVDTKNDY